jgi:phage-related protein
MAPDHKPVVWLRAEVKTPPFSEKARLEAGFLIRMLQAGEQLGMPKSRPMPGIAPRCHELRVNDGDTAWRIVYRTDEDAIVIVRVFAKKSRTTPRKEIDLCRSRLAEYDRIGSS